jgi:hypothetical protein
MYNFLCNLIISEDGKTKPENPRRIYYVMLKYMFVGICELVGIK